MKHPKTLHILLSALALSLFVSLNMQAQEAGLKANQFKAGAKLLGAGASYERRLSSSTTLYSEASVNFVAGSAFYAKYTVVDPSQSSYMYYDGRNYYTYSVETKDTHAWMPAIGAELRKYYNVKKRLANKKKTGNNAFDFIGAGAGYYFKAKTTVEGLEEASFVTAYATWGIQKSVGRIFTFEFNLGPGIRHTISDKENSFLINGNLKFDFVIK